MVGSGEITDAAELEGGVEWPAGMRESGSVAAFSDNPVGSDANGSTAVGAFERVAETRDGTFACGGRCSAVEARCFSRSQW